MALADLIDIDHGILPFIHAMQRGGMGIDYPHFECVQAYLLFEINEQLRKIEREVGRPLNPKSGPQVAKELYENRGLRPPSGKFKKTKSGGLSTEDKTLEAMSGLDPLVDMITDARELFKLHGTYATKIPEIAARAPDRRLHPRFRVTRVPTGRLSAVEPNVLALPKHTKNGKLIRGGFPARKGWLLGSWDLDQIEMRVMAHASGDPAFRQVFLAGLDIHAANAQKYFGVPPDRQDDSKHRLPAKAIGFGTLMGITAKGLRDQLHKKGQTHWTEQQCQQLLDEFYNVLYPGIKTYVQGRHQFCRATGYTEDFMGRRQYLPDIWSDDDRERSAAEREAQAIPIQAGAQIVTKTWMKAAWDGGLSTLYRRELISPWVQIHDDLVIEHKKEVSQEVDHILQSTLPQILSVPVKCKGKIAEVWVDL